MLWHWAKRRHPGKSKQWIVNKYWLSVGKRNWVFSDGTNKLNLLSDTKIVRHIRLKLDMNPHLDKEYFDSRKSKLKVKKPTSITEKVIGIAEKVTDVAKKTLDKVKNICKPETVTMTNNCCPNKGL
jgi:RNA-directed DNA polymerase